MEIGHILVEGQQKYQSCNHCKQQCCYHNDFDEVDLNTEAIHFNDLSEDVIVDFDVVSCEVHLQYVECLQKKVYGHRQQEDVLG